MNIFILRFKVGELNRVRQGINPRAVMCIQPFGGPSGWKITSLLYCTHENLRSHHVVLPYLINNVGEWKVRHFLKSHQKQEVHTSL
jgi:hypothetical protein